MPGGPVRYATLIKKAENVPHIFGNSEGSGAKSYMTNDLLKYGENICAFPHKLGSPFSCAKSYMYEEYFHHI